MLMCRRRDYLGHVAELALTLVGARIQHTVDRETFPAVLNGQVGYVEIVITVTTI